MDFAPVGLAVDVEVEGDAGVDQGADVGGGDAGDGG